MRRLLLVIFLTSQITCHGGVVRTFNGETFQGKVRLEGPGSVVVAPEAGSIVKVELGNVLEADFRENPDPSMNFGSGIMLKNGLFFPTVVEALDGAEIKLRDRNLTVPLSEIAMVVFRTMPVAYADKLPTGQTGAILPDGDFFEGRFKGFSGGRAKVVSLIFGPRNFDVQKDISAVVLSSFQQVPAICMVQTTKGGVYPINSLVVDRDGFVIRDPILKEVRVPSDEVAMIRAGASRYKVLTEIREFRIDPPPGVVAEKAVTVGKTLQGRPLLVAGEYLDQGIEEMVGASITYAVPPGLDVLSTQVAVSERATPESRYCFTVLANGRPVYRSPARGPGDKPQAIRVNFGAAQTLTLRIEGVAPTVNGSGYWVKPVLVRH